MCLRSELISEKYWCSKFLLITLNTVSTLTFLVISTVNLESSRCTFHNCLISLAQHYVTNTYRIRHTVDIWYLVTIQWVNYSKAVDYSNVINLFFICSILGFLVFPYVSQVLNLLPWFSLFYTIQGQSQLFPFRWQSRCLDFICLLGNSHFQDWVLLLNLKRTFYFDSSFHSPPLPTACF